MALKTFFKNLKVFLVYLFIKIFVKKDDRDFLFKWLEFKEGMINEEQLKYWMTTSAYPEEEESGDDTPIDL